MHPRRPISSWPNSASVRFMHTSPLSRKRERGDRTVARLRSFLLPVEPDSPSRRDVKARNERERARVVRDVVEEALALGLVPEPRAALQEASVRRREDSAGGRVVSMGVEGL